MWLTVWARRAGYDRMTRAYEEADVRWLRRYSWLVANWRLVCTARRFLCPRFEAEFQEFAAESNAYGRAKTQMGLFNLDTECIITWAGATAVVFFYVFGGYALIERNIYGQGFMTTGTFVAILQIYNKL